MVNRFISYSEHTLQILYFEVVRHYLCYIVAIVIECCTGAGKNHDVYLLRWFGHQPLESKQCVYCVDLHTAYRAQALAWGAFFVQLWIKCKGWLRADAIALLSFETIAYNSTKMTFGGLIFFTLIWRSLAIFKYIQNWEKLI